MAMTKTQVMKLLRENQNERGIAHWKKRGSKKVKSFGIGLTQLRKLAKQIGRDHKLAMQLWNSDVYDAKVVAFDKMTGKEIWRALSTPIDESSSRSCRSSSTLMRAALSVTGSFGFT